MPLNNGLDSGPLALTRGFLRGFVVLWCKLLCRAAQAGDGPTDQDLYMSRECMVGQVGLNRF
jgi:hypothetical protein